MKSEILYTPRALRMLQDIYAYYRGSSESASKIVAAIQKSISDLAFFPEMGKRASDRVLLDAGFRVIFSGQFAITYKVEGKLVVIYHIADTRSDYSKDIF